MKRIVELGKQAELEAADEFISKDLVTVEGFNQIYTRKLAELVVQECAKVAKNAHGVTIGQGYNVSQQIKHHFGVEE